MLDRIEPPGGQHADIRRHHVRLCRPGKGFRGNDESPQCLRIFDQLAQHQLNRRDLVGAEHVEDHLAGADEQFRLDGKPRQHMPVGEDADRAIPGHGARITEVEDPVGRHEDVVEDDELVGFLAHMRNRMIERVGGGL
ncbi:hypothetical protein D3C71_1105900 [compost metagenome]